MTNLETALSYLEKGLSIIPLYSPEMLKIKGPKNFITELKQEYEKNTQSEQPLEKDVITESVLTKWCKRPCISGWKDYQDRLPTKEEVTHWFTMNPTANIAIITGAISGVVVFDFDSESALEYVEEIGGLPDSTAIAMTGKGLHFYMRYPDFNVSNRVNTNLHLDIRADGGYVAAPPSRHGSGRYYEWKEGFSITQINPSPCTPWMLDYLRNVPDNNTVQDKRQHILHDIPETVPANDEVLQAAKETHEPNTQETKRDKYLDLLQNGCKRGERNHSATRLSGHLLKAGMKETEVWEMLQIWNRGKVKPPLDPDELKKTFESVKALEKKNQTITAPAPKINVNSLLDDINKTVTEYQQNYVRVPFANQNLVDLENHMDGGFAGGRFYIFGGIPSTGKTVLLNNIADNVCLNGYPVLFFSFDDGRAELRYRTFSRFSKHLIEEFNKRMIQNIGNICQLPEIKQITPLKYVVERNVLVDKWQDLIDQIKQIHGKAPVIIIDYLRKLRTEKGNSDERLRVDDILTKLTEIAKINNTPVIAISELARDSYKSGQRLSIASFKESGTIEYEASWLGILAAVEERNGEFIVIENWDSIIKQTGNVDLIIFKAKRGTGVMGRISLKVDKGFMTVNERPIEPAETKKKKKSQFE